MSDYPKIVHGATVWACCESRFGPACAHRTPRRTTRQLADEVIAGLDDEYNLVHVAHDDALTDEQVSAIVRGDIEEFFSSTMDWEGGQRHRAATEIIAQAATVVVGRWETEDDEDHSELLDGFASSEEWERVRHAVEDRDSGSWVRELIDQTPRVLLRINVLDEDRGYAFTDVEPDRVLRDVGLPVTESNRTIMAATLAECSPEFSVLLGYWIVGADVRQVHELDVPSGAEVEIVNPHLYLGNPVAGSGWISENPFGGIVRVRRADLRTDADAFGHSVHEVYGGLSAGDFEAEIRVSTCAEGATK